MYRRSLLLVNNGCCSAGLRVFYLLLIFLFLRPKVGKKLKVLVKGNDVVVNGQTMFSVAIGRTGIVHHQTHTDFMDGELFFSFSSTSWMAPLAHLIVYYMQTTGEIVYDMIALEFDTPLPNEVSFQSVSMKTYLLKILCIVGY